MIIRRVIFLITCIVLVASGTAASADELFLRITDPHDEPRGYCLDIRGQGQGVRLKSPLQVHSCKDGTQIEDIIFDSAALARGTLYMSHYDHCVAATANSSGADLMLASCDPADLQKWRQLPTGEIVLAGNADLCITMRDSPEMSAGPRYIRNEVSLAPCASAAASRQVWMFQAP